MRDNRSTGTAIICAGIVHCSDLMLYSVLTSLPHKTHTSHSGQWYFQIGAWIAEWVRGWNDLKLKAEQLSNRPVDDDHTATYAAKSPSFKPNLLYSGPRNTPYKLISSFARLASLCKKCQTRRSSLQLMIQFGGIFLKVSIIKEKR